MNHAGEISTLVAIAEPDVRVWTNVGDAHLGFFASPDAIADAKAEILERADGDDRARLQRRRPARDGARRRLCRPDGDLRHGGRRRPCARVDVEDRGVDGMRARVRTPAGERDHRDAAARPRQPVERAGRDRRGARQSACRSTTIAAAAARLRPADRRGAVRRLRDGVTLIDDSYNSSPAALRGALEVIASGSRAHRARWRCSARCSSSATTRRGCTRSAAARPRRPA